MFLRIAHAVQINVTIPGAAPAASPEGIVANLYEFALLVGALLAFGAIVFGGVKYALSAGNPSGQSDAREWITDALLGLLLLLGAWLLLNVINPNLTRLYLPRLERLTLKPSPVNAGGYGCDTIRNGEPARFCGSAADCSDIPQCSASECKRIVNCAAKNTGSNCNSGSGCGLGAVCVLSGSNYRCRPSSTACSPACPSGQVCVKEVGPPFCEPKGDP